MSQAAAGLAPPRSRGSRRPGSGAVSQALRIGWRNLWRNRRRTLLTSGGIAFAVLLVVSSMCLQFGSYAAMEDTATSLLAGHLQIVNPAYLDDGGLDDALRDAPALTAVLERQPGVRAVAPRTEAFVLASVGRRSFGAQVLGVDPERERQVVTLHRRVTEGRYLEAADEAVVGAALARNLGAAVGDEVVLLGSGRRGGVAAMVVRISGIVSAGIPELDRALLLVRIDAMRDAFDLGDDAHTLVVRTDDPGRVQSVADTLAERLSGAAPILVRTWHEVMPELYQAIEIDRRSGQVFYWIIMIIVAFSVVNTFIMTVFERTREFGMLMAIGMRPARILVMLQCEALCLWLVGAGFGLALALALNLLLAGTGVPLGDAVEQLAQQMYMPSRIYPDITFGALATAPLVMLAGAQLAALLPGLRIRRLQVVDALRVAA